VLGWDPRLGEPPAKKQLGLQPGVGTVGLGPLLPAPLGRRICRLTEMRLDPCVHHLLDDKRPSGAVLHRERHVVPPGEPLREPVPQHRPGSRSDLTDAQLAGIRVQIVERDLWSVHVKSTYDRHCKGLSRVLDLEVLQPVQKEHRVRTSRAHCEIL